MKTIAGHISMSEQMADMAVSVSRAFDVPLEMVGVDPDEVERLRLRAELVEAQRE